MRTVGALIAGMFAGLLLGALLTEPVARLFAGPDGSVSVVRGLGTPVCAVLGAVTGVVVERRARGRAR